MNTVAMLNGKAKPELANVKRRLDNVFGSYHKFAELINGVVGATNPALFANGAAAASDSSGVGGGGGGGNGSQPSTSRAPSGRHHATANGGDPPTSSRASSAASTAPASSTCSAVAAGQPSKLLLKPKLEAIDDHFSSDLSRQPPVVDALQSRRSVAPPVSHTSSASSSAAASVIPHYHPASSSSAAASRGAKPKAEPPADINPPPAADPTTQQRLQTVEMLQSMRGLLKEEELLTGLTEDKRNIPLKKPEVELNVKNGPEVGKILEQYGHVSPLLSPIRRVSPPPSNITTDDDDEEDEDDDEGDGDDDDEVGGGGGSVCNGADDGSGVDDDDDRRHHRRGGTPVVVDGGCETHSTTVDENEPPAAKRAAYSLSPPPQPPASLGGSLTADYALTPTANTDGFAEGSATNGATEKNGLDFRNCRLKLPKFLSPGECSDLMRKWHKLRHTTPDTSRDANAPRKARTTASSVSRKSETPHRCVPEFVGCDGCSEASKEFRSSPDDRQKITSLQDSLEQLTAVHKKLASDSAELRAEMPKLEKRYRTALDRIKQLETALREVREDAARDRKRHRADMDLIKQKLRL